MLVNFVDDLVHRSEESVEQKVKQNNSREIHCNRDTGEANRLQMLV